MRPNQVTGGVPTLADASIDGGRERLVTHEPPQGRLHCIIASSSLPEIRAYGGRLEAKPTSRPSFGLSGATPDFTVDTSDSVDGGGLLEAQSRDSLMAAINAANSGMRTLFAPSGAKMLRP